MVVGKSYEALDTDTVKRNGLIPGKTGHVIFVDGEAISLQFFERDVKVPRVLFGSNFAPCSVSMTPNMGYQAARHASHLFR